MSTGVWQDTFYTKNAYSIFHKYTNFLRCMCVSVEQLSIGVNIFLQMSQAYGFSPVSVRPRLPRSKITSKTSVAFITNIWAYHLCVFCISPFHKNCVGHITVTNITSVGIFNCMGKPMFNISPLSGVPRGEGGLGCSPPPPPKFRSFEKAAFDGKLSGKCLVFLFQHPN